MMCLMMMRILGVSCARVGVDSVVAGVSVVEVVGMRVGKLTGLVAGVAGCLPGALCCK